MLKELWETLWAVASALADRAQRTNYADALFLPRGQGPGILILGGITMLAVSLFLSLRIPRRAPVSAGPSSADVGAARHTNRSMRFSIVHAHGPPPDEVQAAIAAALEADLGDPQYVAARPDRHGLAFSRCPGEAFSKDGPRGCEAVRERLEEGACSVCDVRVVTVACNPVKARPCVFEIRREDRAP